MATPGHHLLTVLRQKARKMPEIPPPRAPGRADSQATDAASASRPLSAPARLVRQPSFQPCPVEVDDEFFANGIFEFNITRMTAFIDARPDQFQIDSIAIADIPDFGDSGLTEAAVRAADLSRPVLLAEIAPGRYNLIDGNHRVARARRDGVPVIPSGASPPRRTCPSSRPRTRTRSTSSTGTARSWMPRAMSP